MSFDKAVTLPNPGSQKKLESIKGKAVQVRQMLFSGSNTLDGNPSLSDVAQTEEWTIRDAGYYPWKGDGFRSLILKNPQDGPTGNPKIFLRIYQEGDPTATVPTTQAEVGGSVGLDGQPIDTNAAIQGQPVSVQRTTALGPTDGVKNVQATTTVADDGIQEVKQFFNHYDLQQDVGDCIYKLVGEIRVAGNPGAQYDMDGILHAANDKHSTEAVYRREFGAYTGGPFEGQTGLFGAVEFPLNSTQHLEHNQYTVEVKVDGSTGDDLFINVYLGCYYWLL
jgi:hypothetical protein